MTHRSAAPSHTTLAEWLQSLDPRRIWRSLYYRYWQISTGDPQRYEELRPETSQLIMLLQWRPSNDLTWPQVDEYPEGYPNLAAWQQSDPNFLVYRRFGTLRHRLILHRQQELAKLERRLNDHDQEQAKQKPTLLKSLEWDHAAAVKKGNPRSYRAEMIDEIDQKLEHYGTFPGRAPASSRLTERR